MAVKVICDQCGRTISVFLSAEEKKTLTIAQLEAHAICPDCTLRAAGVDVDRPANRGSVPSP